VENAEKIFQKQNHHGSGGFVFGERRIISG
jgi:hypothetical protein